MLELKHIKKQYRTESFTQVALDDVSVAFRDNEFVAILGPSGSGKSTMLNVIGGLDHFDSGDLVIDGVSTKDYRDRDWDTYRNNRVGFVFQSYNLIAHQNVLANVELALTLSGVGAEERHRRAMEVLERVGLGKHARKLPSQLSGGQMQRVAIARALINDPEILLADEPTGALDSVTSVQVMDLLKEVAKDRLVVMVTHNPDLAHRYATRIVELADGRITSDTDPFDPSEATRREAKATRRARMSLPTAFGLSFRNLMTKKGRTFLTAFAGSIGIIGVAAILALSNGLNNYIYDTEAKTLAAYPLHITTSSIDMTSLMSEGQSEAEEARGASSGEDADGSSERVVESAPTLSRMASRVGNNDLVSLKAYLDSNGGNINDYASAIEYQYDVTPHIFLADTSKGVQQVNPDTSFASLGVGGSSGASPMSSMYSMSTDVFSELPVNSSIYEDQYDVLAGGWPRQADELVLVLTRDGRLPELMEYEMGLQDQSKLAQMVKNFSEGVATESDDPRHYTYDQLMAPEFRLVNLCDTYQYSREAGVWVDKSDDDAYMAGLVEAGEPLHVVGIVQPKADLEATSLSSGLYYTRDLTLHLIDEADSSEVVREQRANPELDVFTGRAFDDEANDTSSGFDLQSLITVDGAKIQSAFKFDSSALSNMDLSGLDLSGIDVSGIQMPQMDPSSLDFSDVQIPELSQEELQAALPDVSPEQLAQVLSKVQVHLRDGGQETLQAMLGDVAAGWGPWSQENPDKNVVDYMATAEVREKVSAGVTAAIDTEDLEQQLVSALAEVLGSDATTAQGLAQDALGPLLEAYEQKLAASLASTVASAVGTYLEQALTAAMTQTMTQVQDQLTQAMRSSMAKVSQSLAGAFSVDTAALSEAFQFNMDETQLKEILSQVMTARVATYEDNLQKLGAADLDSPSEIDLYSTDFDAKAGVIDVLDDYNRQMEEAGEDAKVISYTDLVGTILSSVTKAVDMITTLLVAFVSISLVVSSIMIAVITYISVLERKKEIGILRALGASKGNVSQVFNAETVIEGLISGTMGVLITLLVSIPVNALIESQFAVPNLMALSPRDAAILIGIAVVLNFVAGLIPSAKASRSDPVEALRSE